MEMNDDDQNTIKLKRTISATKEEYFLNDKLVNQIDYRSFLEDNNLSQSHSYFIIPQSKIIQLSDQTDSDRYDLLKDICGAKRYETKKNQGLKEIETSNKSLDEIKSTLDNLLVQKEKLQGEKEVFDSYTQKNNELRSIQYMYYKKELDKSNLETAKNGREINDVTQALEIELNNLKEIEEEKIKINKINKQNMDDIKTCNEKILSTEKKIKEEKEKMTKYAQQMALIKPDLENENRRKDFLKKELKKMKNEKMELLNKINSIKEEYEKMKNEYDGLVDERNRNNNRLQQLIDKQNRCSKYKTINERNKALDNDINSYRQYIKECNDRIIEKKKMLEEYDEKNKMIQNQINEINKRDFDKEKNDYENRKRELERGIKDLTEKETNINNIIDETDKKINENTEGYRKAIHNYNAQNNNTINAIKYLKDYCEKNRINGCYGALIDLFTLKQEQTFIAVEKTAGKKLFNCVVDSMETAFNLSNILKNKKMGRVTFIPLNDVGGYRNPIVIASGDKCILVKDLLDYDKKYENAFQYVFSNTIFCGNYEDGLKYSKTYNTNAVIINGNEIKIKGEITGGYIDQSKSILKNYIDMKKYQNILTESNQEKEKYSQESEGIKREINNCKNELSRLILSQSQKLQEKNRLLNKKNEYNNTIKSNEEQKNKIIEDIKSLENSINEKQNEIDELENEKRLPFNNSLSDDELNEMNDCQNYLNETYKISTEMKDKVSKKKNEFDTEKLNFEVLENTENSAIIQLNTFTERDNNQNNNNNRQSIAEISSKYEELNSSISNQEEKIKKLNENLEYIKDNLKQLSKKQEESQKYEDEITKKYDELNDVYIADKIKLDTLNSKSELLINRNYTNMKAMREIGSLPPNQYSVYKDMTRRELERGIEELKIEINNEFGKVNQKSIQQFEQIRKTYEEFSDKYNTLNSEKNEILNYVATIDDKEMKIITHTFDSLNHSFGNVFKSIIPQGNAELHLQYTDGKIDGISMDICFDENSGNKLFSQLSGGQKTIVSIAFLFAVQEISKTPFYLFDEIEDALDDTYRKIISKLIQIKKPNIQFIATTFKKELVEVGDKFIKVESLAQKSAVRDISKSEALSFLTELGNNVENA